jgi:hypothetical protein
LSEPKKVYENLIEEIVLLREKVSKKKKIEREEKDMT